MPCYIFAVISLMGCTRDEHLPGVTLNTGHNLSASARPRLNSPEQPKSQDLGIWTTQSSAVTKLAEERGQNKAFPTLS